MARAAFERLFVSLVCRGCPAGMSLSSCWASALFLRTVHAASLSVCRVLRLRGSMVAERPGMGPMLQDGRRSESVYEEEWKEGALEFPWPLVVFEVTRSGR